jgi:serine/threonine protein kinase
MDNIQQQQHQVQEETREESKPEPELSFAFSETQASSGGEPKKKKRKKLGKYIIGDVIGKGGAAVVHQGYNVETKEYVAIKKFLKGLMTSEQIKAVKGELELMLSLVHPNIVRVVDNLEDNSNIYIILEYVDSGSLATLLREYGGFPPSLVARLVAQILRGLEYLHKQGIIHRDIKAANLLITKEGVIKLADFGASAKLKDETEKRYSIVGTPYWMAPEVIQMAGHRMASDIWSLGCTVIELLTGHPPYWELDQMRAIFCVVQEPMPPIPENIPPELKDFLCRCFVKDPTHRATVEELLAHPFVKDVDLSQKLTFREIKKQLKALKKNIIEKLPKADDAEVTQQTSYQKMKSLIDADKKSTKNNNFMLDEAKTNSSPISRIAMSQTIVTAVSTEETKPTTTPQITPTEETKPTTTPQITPTEETKPTTTSQITPTEETKPTTTPQITPIEETKPTTTSQITPSKENKLTPASLSVLSQQALPSTFTFNLSTFENVSKEAVAPPIDIKLPSSTFEKETPLSQSSNVDTPSLVNTKPPRHEEMKSPPAQTPENVILEISPKPQRKSSSETIPLLAQKQDTESARARPICSFCSVL